MNCQSNKNRGRTRVCHHNQTVVTTTRTSETKMVGIFATLFVLATAVSGGLAGAVVPAPAVAAAPLVAAPAPFVATAAAAPVAAPLVAAPAPIAYTKAVPQAVLPFASSLNLVARAPFLPYTVARAPVVSPVVETFSAPLVAPRLAPFTAARFVAPGPFLPAVL